MDSPSVWRAWKNCLRKSPESLTRPSPLTGPSRAASASLRKSCRLFCGTGCALEPADVVQKARIAWMRDLPRSRLLTRAAKKAFLKVVIAETSGCITWAGRGRQGEMRRRVPGKQSDIYRVAMKLADGWMDGTILNA